MFGKKLKTIALCSGLVLTISAGRLECANPTGWLLSQTSGIAGDYDLYINPQSIRLNKRTEGIRIYSQAPAWRVIVVNDKSHKFIETSLQDFSGPSRAWAFQSYALALNSGKWSKVGLAKCADRDMFKYKMLYGGDFALDMSLKKMNRKSNRSADYGELTAVTLPRPELFLLRKIYVLPDSFTGLPVYLDLSGDGAKALRTEKIDTCSHVPQLIPPASYKKESLEANVYKDPQGEALTDSLTNWLGPSTSTDRKSK